MKRFNAAIFFLGVVISATMRSPGVEIEMVTIGNPGNAPDTRHSDTGFGAVDYVYQIGKYEITNGQYAEFLNTKATVGDPHGLFNENMGIDSTGGIGRMGSGTIEDPWVYFPKDFDIEWYRRPVNFVGVWDAARFINWLHNGQGDGDTETGAYLNIDDVLAFARQPGARIVLPTEDEWYKAAYYDPEKPGGPGYWEYPTQSDTSPTNDSPPGTSEENGSANFGLPALTPVGAYTAKPSTSAYGTFDQGGNLWEWNETIVLDDYYGLRGGSFDNIYGLDANHRDSYPADLENRIMGFRIANVVPEPSSMWLVVAVALIVGTRRLTFKCLS